jgi:hypothetical protein
MIAGLALHIPAILLVEVVTRREYFFSPHSTPLAELSSDLKCISAASCLGSPDHLPYVLYTLHAAFLGHVTMS